MKNDLFKTLGDILRLDGEPNILGEMADNNYKDYNIKMLLKSADCDAVVLDGYNDAIIGIDVNGCIVYDYNLMVSILMLRDNMETIDAVQFLNEKIVSVQCGELKPTFVMLNLDIVIESFKKGYIKGQVDALKEK
jgi:hypothetical protein